MLAAAAAATAAEAAAVAAAEAASLGRRAAYSIEKRNLSMKRQAVNVFYGLWRVFYSVDTKAGQPEIGKVGWP